MSVAVFYSRALLYVHKLRGRHVSCKNQQGVWTCEGLSYIAISAWRAASSSASSLAAFSERLGVEIGIAGALEGGSTSSASSSAASSSSSSSSSASSSSCSNFRFSRQNQAIKLFVLHKTTLYSFNHLWVVSS